MILLPDYRPMLLGETALLRRQAGEASPRAFADLYLRHYFTADPSRMHLELFDLLRDITAERGRRVAVAAPRGHAKTTLVSLAYVLWCVLYGKEQFVLMISATSEQATQLLTDLKKELTENPYLLSDFPEVCGPLGLSRAGMAWKRNRIDLPNGPCVRVLGAGQGLRGMKHRQHRPSLIICDDLEELESTYATEQRQKTRDWFEKTLLKAGNRRTNFVVIGTILHYDSLLANLTRENPRRGKPGGWEGRVYRAVEHFSSDPGLWERWEAIRFREDEYEGQTGMEGGKRFYMDHREQMLAGTKVLWPSVDGYLNLMTMRANEGRPSFQMEKQNEPLDPQQCLFSHERFVFWDDPRPGGPQDKRFDTPAELFASLERPRVFGACDPSLGKRIGRGDYSAIITIVQQYKSREMYVIGADIVRKRPEQLIEMILKLANTYQYYEFAVEANQFQELLADELENRARTQGTYMNIKKVNHSANKQARIEGLEPLISSGQIRFSRKHEMLLDQLRQFPLGDHDDGPDALEMAVVTAISNPPSSWTSRDLGEALGIY